MSLTSLRPIGSRVAAVRGFPVRTAALVGLVVLAYNYSLLTLARGLTLQTPLAYLFLVPLIALVLAVARVRIEPRGLPIHDRQLDWIVGIALLGVATGVLVLLPDSTSSVFWLQRIDLLTLPLFVAGLIALLFGVRRVWSLKGPLAFLLLAWPVPYTLFLTDATAQFTEITARAVGAFASIVPVAKPSLGDDTMFYIGSGAQAFGVSIGSACAGVNSFVGFLLLGTALLYLVRGPILRRIVWLGFGLTLIFGLNLVRIIAILLVGANFGQAAAFDVLHPIAGLIVFSIGVVGMTALVPVFGLRFVQAPARSAEERDSAPSPVRRVQPALIVAALVAVALAATNAAYSRFDAISSGLTDARLTSFDARNATVADWQARPIGAFPQAQQYFGSSATWDRTLWWPDSGASLYSSNTLWVDVVTTDDQGTFAAYGIEACYRFHGYNIVSVTKADVGAGVQAQVIDYVNTKQKSDWSALWWEWPFNDKGVTRYERIVILLGNGPDTKYSGITAADIGTQSPRFVDTDRFLVTVARDIVKSQLSTARAS